MHKFKFDFNDITARDMDTLIRGDIQKMADVLARCVVDCKPEIGDLKQPATYLDLPWKVWKAQGGLIEQASEEAKNV